jgi:hypothetical protein
MIVFVNDVKLFDGFNWTGMFRRYKEKKWKTPHIRDWESNYNTMEDNAEEKITFSKKVCVLPGDI